MRAAAAEHYAMMILGIKDTAKEVAIVTLAGYVAVGFEAAVAVTRAGTYWGRIKNIYSVVKGVRSISRLNAVREIIQTGGRVLLRNGPRFLRFTAH